MPSTRKGRQLSLPSLPLFLTHRLPSRPCQRPPLVASHLRRRHPSGRQHARVPRRERLPGRSLRPTLFLPRQRHPLMHIRVKRTQWRAASLVARTLPSRVHIPTHPSPPSPPQPPAPPPRHPPPSPPPNRSQPSCPSP